MRITTWNVNGLRAAVRKGLAEYLDRIRPDVLLLQEIRVRPEQLPDEWRSPPGWHVRWHPAVRPGYSGVAVWSREPVRILGRGLDPGTVGRIANPSGSAGRTGSQFCGAGRSGSPSYSDGDDPEGRVLRIAADGVQIICAYLPSGSSGEIRQRHKEAWMAKFLPWAERFTRSKTPVVLGGDLNIAHTERDIFYAKSNEKTSGFLPHEREWFGRFLGSGWDDFIREHAGSVQGPYSWWSNRGRARELDRGWRIDYLLGNRAAAHRFRTASILRDGGLAISDHAPVTIELA